MVKKIAAIFTTISLVFSVSLVQVSNYVLAEESAEFHTSDSSIFGEEDSFDDLNYGFYWTQQGNQYVKANQGNDEDYYEKSKPTMIFIHGLQGGGGAYQRETYASYDNDYINQDDSVYLADPWLNEGYNVLSYQWNQFCGEDMPWVAEAKIWTTDGLQGMRWKQKVGGYTSIDDERNPTMPLAMLFVEEYLEILKDHQGEEIRLVGHSLGGMFAVAVMGLLSEMVEDGDIDESLLPSRLSLLDPYVGLDFLEMDDLYNIEWKNKKDKFKNIKGNDIKLVIKDYIKKLYEKGVAIDYYWGTIVGSFALNDMLSGEDNFDISPYVTVTQYDSLVYPNQSESSNPLQSLMDMFSNIGGLHCQIRDYYLYSINFDANDYLPLESEQVRITASTPSTVVYANAGKYYYLTNPNETLSPEDDEFILSNKANPSTPLAVEKGKISGFTFKDYNRNGIKDSVGGYKDIKVELYDINDNLIDTVYTSESGFYSFESPGEGEYYLVFNHVFLTKFSPVPTENNYDFGSSIDEEGKTASFVLTSDNTNVYLNAGLIPQTTRFLLTLVAIVGILGIGGFFLFTYFNSKKKKSSPIAKEVDTD